MRTQPLHPIVRRSPYFPATERAGCTDYMVYNHMYMPMDYGRDPRDDYLALVERVTLWDVGAERQTQLRGDDALRLADYLCTRPLLDLEVGECRYAPVCDLSGQLMAECVVLRPLPDVVWISHGDVDLTPWAQAVALHGSFKAEVCEPDVAPLQLQGPSSLDVLVSLIGPSIADLGYYRCRSAEIAGVELVISRTGWSRGMGFELLPLSSERALQLWDVIVAAGQAHGLLVTGPNLSRACEQAITDNCYAVNCGMTPYESGVGWAVGLEGRQFVGRDALQAAASSPAERKTVGLKILSDQPLPPFEEFWQVKSGAEPVGWARWSAHSYALGCPIAIALVKSTVEKGQVLNLEHPGGESPAEVVDLPFVD